MTTLVRLFGCLLLFGATLALFLEQNNRLTKLRIELPHLQAKIKERENTERSLRYELDQKESPKELLKEARRPEFAHLEYPARDQVLVIGQEGV